MFPRCLRCAAGLACNPISASPNAVGLRRQCFALLLNRTLPRNLTKPCEASYFSKILNSPARTGQGFARITVGNLGVKILPSRCWLALMQLQNGDPIRSPSFFVQPAENTLISIGQHPLRRERDRHQRSFSGCRDDLELGAIGLDHRLGQRQPESGAVSALPGPGPTWPNGFIACSSSLRFIPMPVSRMRIMTLPDGS
jgi:hypothetical protein